MLQDAFIIFSDVVFLIIIDASFRESALAQSGDVARICQGVAIT